MSAHCAVRSCSDSACRKTS